jgi:hypothetical protein
MYTNDTLQFSYYAFDQLNNQISITEEWAATGGMINNNGLFTAGSEEGTFEVILEDSNTGITDTSIVILTVDPTVSVELLKYENPGHIQSIFPNPFLTSTRICFSLKERCNVLIRIYNVSGQEIQTLVNEIREKGLHEVRWQASDINSGVYFCRIETMSPKGSYQSDTRKVLLIR